MNRYPLTTEQVETFGREGFVVAPRVFDAADLARVDRVIARITDAAQDAATSAQVLEWEPSSDNGRRVPRRIYNPYEQDEEFRRLANDPRVLDRVESLIGGNLVMQHSKLNMKAARVGSVVEWHQDLTYFPHTNDDLVTTLVYLDDATRENGCLQVMPRQHDHYFSHDSADGYFAGMITEDLADPARGLPKPVALEAPAGSVIFMHCLTPHSSLPNRSPRPRRTLIFEYRAADALALYFDDSVAKVEALCHLVRGRPATHARFGGPPPLIPRRRADTKSLYELQELTRTTTPGVPTIRG